MTSSAIAIHRAGYRQFLATASLFRAMPLVLGIFLCITLSACGVKKLPVAPRATAPGAVTDLRYQQERNQVLLAWSILKGEAAGSSGLSGFNIYMAQYPVDQKDCANCPLLFRRIGQIGEGDLYENGLLRETLSFAWSVAPGYHYAFKVMSVGKNGQLGLESNTVSFDFLP